MANTDAALEQQILHVPQRQWKTDVYQNYQTDHLRR